MGNSVTANWKNMITAAEIDDCINAFRQTMINKYYDLFCSKVKVDGLTKGYLKTLRSRLWQKGSCWVRKDSITGEPIICDYAGATYDWNNEPVSVQLITRNNAPETIIPTSLQYVDKDGCILYVRANQKGYEGDVLYYIAQMAECETLKKVNMAVQRAPWILASDESNFEKLKLILRQIFSNKPALITDIDRSEIDVIKLDAPWLCDKITEYEKGIENELKTLLGIDNQGGYLNREQQNLDTTNSNNDEINSHQDAFIGELKEGLEHANDVLGLSLSIEMPERSEQISASKEHVEESSEEEDE